MSLWLIIFLFTIPLSAQLARQSVDGVVIKDSIAIKPKYEQHFSSSSTTILYPSECYTTRWTIFFNAIQSPRPKIIVHTPQEDVVVLNCPTGWSGYAQGSYIGTSIGTVSYTDCLRPDLVPNVEVRDVTPSSGEIARKEIWFGTKFAGTFSTVKNAPILPELFILNTNEELRLLVTESNYPSVTLSASVNSSIQPVQLVYSPSKTINSEDYLDKTTGEFIIPLNQDIIFYPNPNNKRLILIDASVTAINKCGDQTTRGARVRMTSTIVPSTVHHFEVRLEKDTVAFTESAKIFVKAKDVNDRDVELAADKLVKLSITANNEYGTFINKNGDTLKTTPVELEHVPYGDAKAGLIQFSAVKKNPIDPLLCKVRVELESDPSKAGEREIPVVEQTLKIVMEGEREVEPRNLRGLRTAPIPTNANKKEFKVQLTRNKAAVPNHSFELTTDYIDGTGGHDHVTPRRTQNRDNYGYFILRRDGRDYDRPYNGQTQDDGRETFDYVSSFFGDRMRLKVETTQPNKKHLLWDTISVIEKVANLIRFHGPGNYSLTGATTTHTDNHYFYNQSAIDDLIEAADAFFEQEWNTTGTMRLNDMSLEWGGIFDIKTGSKAWSPPHNAHRNGKSVDIENIELEKVIVTIIETQRDTVFTVPKIEFIKLFKNFMEQYMQKWKFIDEGQLKEDIFERKRLYPHFEWKGN